MKDMHAPSQEVRPHIPTDMISFAGAELIWIDAILLVPAIFGVMFLPALLRAIALSLMIGLVATYFVLFAWARVHPETTVAHLLAWLHIGPTRQIGA